MPEGCYLVLDDPDGIATAANNAWSACEQIAQRQKKRRAETEPLPAQCVLREPEVVLRQLERMPRVVNRALGGRSEDVVDFGGQSGRHYEGHVQLLKEDLRKHWLDAYEVVVLCESEGQKARLEEILEESADIASLYVGTLQSGFTYRPGKVFLINDHEIYSRVHRRRRYRRFQDAQPIKTISALQRGDFVVHVDHGIGRFDGVERIEIGRMSSDCLTIGYRDGGSGFCAGGSDESGAKIFRTRWHSTRIEQIGHRGMGAAKGKDAQSHIQNGGRTRVIIRRTQGATGHGIFA